MVLFRLKGIMAYIIKEKTMSNREIWRSIDGYANYEISSFGRVRNATTERMLKLKKNNRGYFQVCLSKNSENKSHNIHQLVAREFIDNPLNKATVDHIDNDRTNNNIDNLRFASFSENGGNQTKRSNTSSVYKGVSFHKGNNKWYAQIQVNKCRKSLGYFEDEKEAAKAYNDAAAELFGEFAKVNLID